MRDLRDPEKVGRIIQTLVRGQRLTVLNAADELSAYAIADYVSPDCIGRYGKPGQHEPRWEEIQTR